MCLSVSDFDRFSLTIARWLTNVYDANDPAGKSTTRGDVTINGSCGLTRVLRAQLSRVGHPGCPIAHLDDELRLRMPHRGMHGDPLNHEVA